jgi:hypothetical protein
MTTATSPPATAGRILVLDLGKYKTVACAHPGDPAGARVESTVTDREHLRLSLRLTDLDCRLCVAEL